MSLLLVGALAVLVTASVTLPLGWWLGHRRRSLREATLEAKLASAHHVLDVQNTAAATVAKHAMQAMSDLVHTSVHLLREQRGRS